MAFERIARAPAHRNVMPLIRSKEDWLEPWYPIEDAARAGALLKELRAELSKSHVIYGIGAHAIGARQDCDDVVFELSDGKFAVVHLTYAQHPESNPVYPSTEILENWESFVATRMTTDHDDWTACPIPAADRSRGLIILNCGGRSQ